MDRQIFDGVAEEIEAAPPALTRTEMRARRLAEKVTLNRYLWQQTRQLEYMLLQARDLQELLEILLFSMPRHFSFRAAELWLHDPEGLLRELIVGGENFGPALQLHRDSFEMQELYDLEPDVELVDATDPRMFQILKSDSGIEYALLLPLTDGGRMIGSLHLGLQDNALVTGDEEQDLVAHLAAVISACLRLGVSRQQVSRLTVLDPVTGIGNLRGFGRDIAREIARARRAHKPVTVLMAEIDECDHLFEHYGHRSGQFVVKKVAERISSDLRATDSMARLARSRLALLVPASDEVRGGDVAERMRRDIEDFSIDDGHGAVLQVTLSIGQVTWEPQQYPAVDMIQLARQMENVAEKALEAARTRGGNQVALSRLSTLIV